MQKRRGLGRGLNDLGVNELLGGSSRAAVADKKQSAREAFVAAAAQTKGPVSSDKTLQELKIDQLQPGQYQPRGPIQTEALSELADSIRAQGIIQPIVVRRNSLGSYEIIAGERRWRAAQLAGLTQVPVVVRELSDQEAMAIALIENIQRQDLNAIEEALAYERLLNEFSMTHQAVAESVGKSRAAVSNTLRLLQLNHDVQEMVRRGRLNMGHARALLALEGRHQSKVAEKIVAKALSVRETERLVRQIQLKDDGSIEADDALEATEWQARLRGFERDFTQKLSATVSIRADRNGSGRLNIAFKDEAELKQLLARIQ